MTMTALGRPLVALRNDVRYVGEFGPLFVGRTVSIAAAHRADNAGMEIVVAAQRNDAADPAPDDLHPVGVACKLVQLQQEDNGSLRLMLEGMRRVRLANITRTQMLTTDAADWPDEASSDADVLEHAWAVQNAFETVRAARGMPAEVSSVLSLGWRSDLPDAHLRADSLVYLAQRYLERVPGEPVFPLDVRLQLLEAPSLAARLALLAQRLGEL